MHTSLTIVILIYIALTFLTFLVLITSMRHFQGAAKSICIFLSIASGWAVANNIFWLFFENSFKITKKFPLFTEYTDYMITTPLSLIALSYFAMNKMKKDKTLIGVIVFSDIIMLLSGAVAEHFNSSVRQIIFWAGCLPFVVIVFLIWHSLRIKAKKQNKMLHRSFIILAAYLTLLWTLYPLFWYLGPYVLALLSTNQVDIAYHLVSIFTKAGYYLLFYIQLRKVTGKSPAIGSGGT